MEKLIILVCLVAIVTCDLREDCQLNTPLTANCIFDGEQSYGLPYRDTELERINFDRLPTWVNLENLPNVNTLIVESKLFDSKAACEHLINNVLSVRVFLGADKPVVCVSTSCLKQK